MNVAIGELMRDRLLAEGIPASKITVIPNWADGRAITPGRTCRQSIAARVGARTESLSSVTPATWAGRTSSRRSSAPLSGSKMIQGFDSCSSAAARRQKASAKSPHSAELDNLLFQPYQQREMLKIEPRRGRCAPRRTAAGPGRTDRAEQDVWVPCRGQASAVVGDPDGEIGREIEVEKARGPPARPGGQFKPCARDTSR